MHTLNIPSFCAVFKAKKWGDFGGESLEEVIKPLTGKGFKTCPNRLEICFRVKPNEGSNPSLSVRKASIVAV